MTMSFDDNEDDDPLPLVELRHRLTTPTYERLLSHEAAQRSKLLELEEELECGDAIVRLFDSSSCDDVGTATGERQQGHKCGCGKGSTSAERRVLRWTSSPSNPDGCGGIFRDDAEDATTPEDGAISVYYVLSDVSGGHGETVWAASRRLANVLADPKTCYGALSPLLRSARSRCAASLAEGEHGGGGPGHDRDVVAASDGPQLHPHPRRHHPLLGRKVCELGAGGGVPSWVALSRGAQVVCTDLYIPNRIKCLAESAERNRRAVMSDTSAADESGPSMHRRCAEEVRVCPYDWGSDVDEVAQALLGFENRHERFDGFDVVLASDCVYDPRFHAALLSSVQKLLADDGVALLPFALHGNAPDADVWGIADRAKEMGLKVERLEAKQLTPQSMNMDGKRALVHMLRLTKRKDIT